MNINEAVDSIIYNFKENFFKEYNTFNNAKKNMNINGYRYIYDGMSLGKYYSELPYDIEIELFNKLTQKLKLEYEEEKERRERIFLLRYAMCNPLLNDYKIKKEVRPDFVLEKEQKIGIEVTELCVKKIKILGKAANILKSEKNLKLAKECISKKYGKVVNGFKYFDFNGTFAVSTNTFCVTDHKKSFAETIIKKLKNYENLRNLFDKIIILCVCDGIEITCDEDVIDVFKFVDYVPKIKIHVNVVYMEDGQNKCVEKIFG